MELKRLSKRINYKWRIGQVFPMKAGKAAPYAANCLAYIDARDVMDLLDEVVGPDHWQDDYKMIGTNLVAGIGIYQNDLEEWVWKWDTGTSGNIEEEKSIYSDSFKRAAVKWGIGRFLYGMKTELVYCDQNKKPVYPHNLERIYDLTEYINSKEKHNKESK